MNVNESLAASRCCELCSVKGAFFLPDAPQSHRKCG